MAVWFICFSETRFCFISFELSGKAVNHSSELSIILCYLVLQLITVFILGLVVIYIYAVISFALLPNYFIPTNDQFCDTMFQCFITITRLGLLDTLGTVCTIFNINICTTLIIGYSDTSI